MRRTPTTPEKAAKSANARLKANQEALQRAHASDIAAGADSRQRHQVRAATEWLRSEMTALSEQDRREMLDHLIDLCQTANARSRLVVVPANAG